MAGVWRAARASSVNRGARYFFSAGRAAARPRMSSCPAPRSADPAPDYGLARGRSSEGNLIAPFQRKDRAGLVRRGHRPPQTFDDLAHHADLLGIGLRQTPLPGP